GKIEHAIDQVAAQIIGDQQFLDQSQPDEKERPPSLGRFERLTFFELLEQYRNARDRPRQNGREERYGRQVRQVTRRRLRDPLVQIERISERLKRIKREGDRKFPVAREH